MKRILLIVPVLFLTTALLWGSDVVAGQKKISSDLAKHPSSSTLDVIVQYRRAPASRNYAHAAKAGAVATSRMHFIKAAGFMCPRKLWPG